MGQKKNLASFTWRLELNLRLKNSKPKVGDTGQNVCWYIVERPTQSSTAQQLLGNHGQAHMVLKGPKPKSDPASVEHATSGTDNTLLAREPQCLQRPVVQTLTLIVSSSSSGFLTIITNLFKFCPFILSHFMHRCKSKLHI